MLWGLYVINPNDLRAFIFMGMALYIANLGQGLPKSKGLIVVMLIISLMVFFGLITVKNAEKPIAQMSIHHEQVERLNMDKVEKIFYASSSEDFKYPFPLLNDADNWIGSPFKEASRKNSNGTVFGLIYDKNQIGKTIGLKEFVKFQQNRGIPAIYVSMKDHSTFLSHFQHKIREQLITIPVSEKLFEEIITHFNEKHGKIPLIVLDDIQNAFRNTECHVCKYMAHIHQKSKVNVLMATNSSEHRWILANDEKISANLELIELKPRKGSSFENYLVHEINEFIDDPMKFSGPRIDILFEAIPFSWDVLNDYVINHHDYKNVIEYCENWKLKNIIKKWHLENQDIQSVLRTILQYSYFKHSFYKNDFISHEELAELLHDNLNEKLKTSLDYGLILHEGNRFAITPEAFKEVLIGFGYEKPMCY